MYPMQPSNTNQGGGFVLPNQNHGSNNLGATSTQTQQPPYPTGIPSTGGIPSNSNQGGMSPYPGYINSNQPPYPEGGLQLPYNSKNNGRLGEQSPHPGIPGGLPSGYGVSSPTPSSPYAGSPTTFGSNKMTSNLPVKQGDHKPYPGSSGAYPGSQSNYTGFSKGGHTSWPGGASYPNVSSVDGVPKTSFNPSGMSTNPNGYSNPLYPNLGTVGQPGVVQGYGVYSQQSSYPNGGGLPYPVKPPGHP